MKTKREKYNADNSITFKLNFNTNDKNYVRIDKFVNGEWNNQFDGNLNLKQAKNKVFEISTGYTKKHYKRLFEN